MRVLGKDTRISRTGTGRRVGRSKLSGRCVSLRFVILVGLLFYSGNRLFAGTKRDGARSIRRIQAIADRFRHDLAITDRVFVSIVARNEKLVSVERSKKRHGGFILSFDESFLSSLDDKELRASIAHELGHVWIFMHHPYLQTELRANEIALRVVKREDLEKIYSKVWKNKGEVNLKEFLGEETAVGLKPQIRIKSLPSATDRLSSE